MNSERQPDVELTSVPDADKATYLSTLQMIKAGGFSLAKAQENEKVYGRVRVLIGMGLVKVHGEYCAVTAHGETALVRHGTR
jgi:hypothetical protein